MVDFPAAHEFGASAFCFLHGTIRNLEVMSNGDVSKVGKEVGSMAATLQCIVWVQFENHASFCNAVQSLCGHVMQKVGQRFLLKLAVD